MHMNPRFVSWKKCFRYSVPLLLLFSASTVYADEPHAGTMAINTGDNAWILASSALVLMMTAPGLILFYGGLVRTKNVLSTMMHSLILMALVSMLWMVFGYSMAFAPGNAFVGNPMTWFMLNGVGGDPNPAYS